MKIAITGNIGSGKSTFSKFALKKGFPVLFTDDISKTILDSDTKVRELVIKEFGEMSFKNLIPNKAFLSKEVFNNPKKLQSLESILHPRVIKSIEKLSKELLKKHKIVFTETALIYEADMETMFDYVVLITAKRSLRLQRKLAVGLTEEEFSKREQNQYPEEEKMKRADFIFSNNSTLEDLETKFNLLNISLSLN
jgi:dephospho-CoA kinase